jgi:hypothetical protein
MGIKVSFPSRLLEPALLSPAIACRPTRDVYFL